MVNRAAISQKMGAGGSVIKLSPEALAEYASTNNQPGIVAETILSEGIDGETALALEDSDIDGLQSGLKKKQLLFIQCLGKFHRPF